MDWSNYPRYCFRMHVRIGVLMRNRYLDSPSVLEIVGAVTLAVIGLSFIYVLFKIIVGVVLCLIALL
jgi:hypothetical protein